MISNQITVAKVTKLKLNNLYNIKRIIHIKHEKANENMRTII